MRNCILLLLQAVAYFSVMATLFRLRRRVGIGLFVCALGVMHFLETYLASVFYVALPFGVVSPGSTVLFSGKLAMLLLLYMKEDAAAVRQPIYGLLIGNFLMVGLVLILRQHEIVQIAGRTPDIAFIDEMGWLMVWGTILLYFDAIFVILLYEKLGRWLGGSLLPRIAIASSCVLTFDQIGFFIALHVISGAPLSVFLGGWVAKMAAALIYSVMLVGYLRWFERPRLRPPVALTDVFDMLTYRERYEALVEHAGRDSLTGLMHRGRFEANGQSAIEQWRRSAAPLSLLVMDIDHFKSVNDRHGHATGDRVLQSIARTLTECVREDGQVFRVGGEEFAILCRHPHAVARLLGEHIRQAVFLSPVNGDFNVTLSIGIATASPGLDTLADLFATADERLYAAKAAGRDRVVGESLLRDEARPRAAGAT